jgi:O-antigen/teichoic acid export membrane protein
LSTPRIGLAGRLALNSIVQAAGSALAALLGFLLFIAVARTLGASAYGDFVTATAVLAIPVVLADLGLSATVVREISAHPERTERAFGASLPLRAALSLAFVGLTVGLTGAPKSRSSLARSAPSSRSCRSPSCRSCRRA